MNKYDIEYSTYDWGRLINIMSNLLKDGYVCRIATEGDLYVLDAIGTYDCDYKENGITCYDANRNETVFMTKEIFEEKYIEVIANDDKEKPKYTLNDFKKDEEEYARQHLATLYKVDD